jgi:hypothetical protein
VVLTRLQRVQQEACVVLLDMECRVQGTEQRQEQCTTFLARAVTNPTILDTLLVRCDRIGGWQEAATARRHHAGRRDGGPHIRGDGPGGATTDMLWYEFYC